MASTGDSAAPAGYPAFSPNVLAVGGTSLSIGSNNTYQSEIGWADSGGGISTYESEPAYQYGVVPTTVTPADRAMPDVAFDA